MMSIEEIKQQPNNSIKDAETIRFIAMYAIKNNDNSLNCKVYEPYEYLGLYPHQIETFNIFPDKLPINQELLLKLSDGRRKKKK